MFTDGRYNTICSVPDTMCIVRVSSPKQRVNAYCVDDSRFVPMSEAVKAVTQNGTFSPDKSLYDYPDGKDDGRKVPFDRTHRNTGDIVDIMSNLRAEQKDVSDKIKDAKDIYDREQADKARDDYYKNLMSGSSGSSGSSGDS